MAQPNDLSKVAIAMIRIARLMSLSVPILSVASCCSGLALRPPRIKPANHTPGRLGPAYRQFQTPIITNPSGLDLNAWAVGDVLSASTGTWINNPTTYSYRWQRCAPGCSNINGATANTYALTSEDQDATVRVLVTARNKAGAGTSASAPTGIVGSGFVTESHGKLYLDGSPYTFVGFNFFPLNRTAPGFYSCGYQPANYDQDLTDWQMSTVNAVDRIWAFQAWMTKTNGSRTWQALDDTLATLRAHHMRAILTLTDYLGACDNAGPKYETWFRSTYKDTVSPGDKTTYKAYVTELAARYANDPTVMAYELGNEIDGSSKVLTNFADDMYSTLKSVDPNHLVFLGNTNPALDSTALDLCTWHDYGEPLVPLPASLPAQISECSRRGKALFVGEEGIGLGTDPGINTLQDRANALAAKLRKYFPAGIQGYLAWEYDEAAHVSTPPGYAYTAKDPALQILKKYGTR